MSTEVSDVVDLNNRAQIILEAVDEEIAEWFQTPGDKKMLFLHLGMTPEDYTKFLFSPKKWAIDYVKKLHGDELKQP